MKKDSIKILNCSSSRIASWQEHRRPPLRCLTILRSGSLQDKGKQIWPTPDGKFAYHLDTSLTRLVA